MTPEAFNNWLAEMKAAGLARSDAKCAALLGISANSVVSMKERGADMRTALACAALVRGIEPYSSTTIEEFVALAGTEAAPKKIVAPEPRLSPDQAKIMAAIKRRGGKVNRREIVLSVKSTMTVADVDPNLDALVEAGLITRYDFKNPRGSKTIVYWAK